MGYCQLANFIFKSHRMHSIHRSMWSIATDFRRSAVCLSVSVFSWSMVTLMYCANKKLSYRIEPRDMKSIYTRTQRYCSFILYGLTQSLSINLVVSMLSNCILFIYMYSAVSTERGSFWGCLANWKALGVSPAVYAAKGIIQSPTAARHLMRLFVKILWSLVAKVTKRKNVS